MPQTWRAENEAPLQYPIDLRSSYTPPVPAP